MRKFIMTTAALALCCITGTALAYTEEQAEKGKEIFAKQCAECHGAGGEGGVVPNEYTDYAGIKAPPVAGKGSLPHMKTAGNTYAFIKSHMPLQSPGSLSSEEALNLVAFDLKANGKKADGQPLTVESAKKIMLHEKQEKKEKKEKK